MRLTLRTLLAYRDRVLSPSDSEDLHRRIQSSQDAGNLLRRIGAVTQRNAVLAPPVLGKGLGGDPNVIAEYLDDVLQHSEVPELERICLVSDVQLAELADCHSMLSSAIQTKVSVSSELRRMATELGNVEQRVQIVKELEDRKAPRRRGRRTEAIVRTDEAHATAPVEPVNADTFVEVQAVQAPMLVSGGESIKPQGLDLESTALTHEVPDYLMSSSAGHWKIPLAIGALAAVLAILLWQSLGPWDKVTELFASVPNNERARIERADRADLDTIVESEQLPPGMNNSVADESLPDSSVEIDAENLAPPGATAAPASDASAAITSTNRAAAKVTDKPLLASPTRGEEGGLPTTVDEASSVKPEVEQISIDSEDAAPPGSVLSGETDESNNVAAELKALSDQETPVGPVTGKSSAESHAVWLPSDAEAAQAVILWRDDGEWRRVAAGEPLPIGSTWVIPPATRTTIDLPGGVLWTACGPSRMDLSVDKQGGPSGTRVVTSLCRALIRGGPDGNIVHLATPCGDFKLELNEPNSLASVEVAYRPVELGSIIDPKSTRPVLIVVAAEESLRVTKLVNGGEGAESGFDLQLGDGLACLDEETPSKFRLQSIPSWFRTSVERPIDSLAAAELHRVTASKANSAPVADGVDTESSDTAVGAGVGMLLTELSKSRRPETAALAVQTSLLCNNWKPLSEGFLDDARMRIHWTPTLNLARQLLAASPTFKADVQKTFSDRYGDSSSDMLELISGLPAEQINNESMSSIVQRLESSQLAMRVLALYQLQLMTGKTLGLQPAAVNRSGVQQWRRELATNRTLLAVVPDPIWESIADR